MKRTRYIIIALLLLSAVFLSACGRKTNDGVNNKCEIAPENQTENDGNLNPSDQMPVISGQILEVGEFTVLIPEGWFANFEHPTHMNDELAENEISIVKGTDDQKKMSEAPALFLAYGCAENPISSDYKKFCESEENEKIESLSIGDRTFNGYKAKGSEGDVICLFAENGEEQFQIVVYYNRPGGQISLEDADVRAIIESFRSKETSGMPD